MTPADYSFSLSLSLSENQPHLLAAMSWFIIFVITILVCVPTTLSANEDQRYLSCGNTFDCGSIKGISYPFRGSGGQEYCGYPGFELDCSGQDPRITIMNLNYKVLGIDNQTRILDVVRADYTENICPMYLRNTSLMNPNVLNYTSEDRNLTIYYGCPPTPSLPISGFSTQFPCNINETDISGFFITANLSDLNFVPGLVTYLESCSTNVKVPTRESVVKSIIANVSVPQLLGAINKGFGLVWDANHTLCDACKRSGGHCGYDQTTTAFTCYCKDQPHEFVCGGSPSTTQSTRSSRIKRRLKIAIGISAAVAAIIAFSMIAICFTRRKDSYIATTFMLKKSDHVNRHETFMMNCQSLTPKPYSYSDIKKITNSFINIIGHGGFGNVYKGKLPDGRIVAVKVLKESKGDGEDFMNEVASISRTSHVNIVSLLGFCYERTKKALIYEYMPNGSLDKFISYEGSPQTNRRLEWKKLYEIAVGIARGLEYLHRGCNTRIVHFDIKPHNILLDEDFCPKISDFGLSKLCKSKVSKVSMIGTRGTAGYIAPEVIFRNFGGVTYKSDVYSYGMMVLEMVGERKKFDIGSSETSEMYFPDWFYKNLAPGEISILHEGITHEEEEIVRKMVFVGLWCIQTNPSDRPSMTKVVEMFEGSQQSLEIPPRPFLSSPKTSAQKDSSSISSLTCVSLQMHEEKNLSSEDGNL